MKTTFPQSELDFFFAKLATENPPKFSHSMREPVHVVYGGAHLFTAETPQKLGKLALRSIDTYAPNFVEFAEAMWLKGADSLPKHQELIEDLEFKISDNPEKIKVENFPAWFAWNVFRKTVNKVKNEPVEDFRIDFEDGYGIRSNSEEDEHAISASDELAKLKNKTLENSLDSIANLPFCGVRIKSFQKETFQRAARTLNLFLTNLFEKCGGNLPENFAVTLPKITRKEEIEVLAELLDRFEKINEIEKGLIKIEIMIETPQAIVNENSEIALKKLVEAGNGRVNSAHFGAFDYTASFGISGIHQHLQHEACNFARQMMQIALSPLNIRLSDSVTTEMPVPVHRGENLTNSQIRENKNAVIKGWRKHFNNVTNSLINGFYQSWDLHPAQIAARYAAVYAFFIESQTEQATRLKGFLDKATKAMLTGNQFDDAASAQGLLNFFIRANNCGAISENEILAQTGLSGEELKTASFQKILESRNNV